MAPYSVAIGARTDTDSEDAVPTATGTLVVLFDPSQADVWGGDFRLVGHLRAQIDSEMSNDPLLGEFLWSSLVDRLHQETTGFSHPLGTVTRELSQTFGGLTLRGSVLNVEVRCSWSTNSTDIGEHLSAWTKYILESAGLPTETHETLYGLEVHTNV